MIPYPFGIKEEFILEMILATTSSTPVIGQIATVLGWVMNGIYKMLELIGIPNLGLCIIIFSILIYLFMTPLQIKQQKFSKLSAVMQPELQQIQKKYQNKKDQASQQKMQEETMAVYEKYGVSPTGSCVQLLIQMPILFALWQVIYKIPGYVSSVGAIFTDAVSKIVTVNGYTDLLQTFITDNKISRVSLVLENGVAKESSVIDFLYALSPSQWKSLASMSEFSGFSDILTKTASEISSRQTFGVLNIADQPMTYISSMLKGGSILVGIAAISIPVLSWLTQMINLKLTPQTTNNSNGNGNNSQDAMANSMKTMNTVMPLMSAFFCLSFPVGLGIYWISSAVVRSIQQIVINRHLNKIDMNDLINENLKKMEKKRAKAGLPPQKITNQAHQSARNIEKESGNQNADERNKKVEESYKKASNAKPGSITAKANLVKDFNERNKK
jgi:YidC/Oxa1 family membrane protein insertase